MDEDEYPDPDLTHDVPEVEKIETFDQEIEKHDDVEEDI